MNGREELTGHQAEDDAGGEIVLVDPVAELEVLVEHGAQGERDGLAQVLISVALVSSRLGKRRPHFEYDVRCRRGIVWVVGRWRNGRGISELETNATWNRSDCIQDYGAGRY